MEYLLKGEVEKGRVEFRVIDGLTIERRAAEMKAIPDDVLAELDKYRQRFLFERIEDDLQSIITTTDLNNFEKEFLSDVNIIEINSK